MKNLSKIISRYLISALIMLLVTLFLNVFLYVILGFRIVQSSNRSVSNIRTLAEELSLSDGQLYLSENGYSSLEENNVWAMVLNDDGKVVWNWKLPENLNHTYTVSQVAAFSKWYLDDYPVTSRITDYGLLVIAWPRGTVWKQNFSDSAHMIKYILFMIPVTLIANLLLILGMVLFFGIRFYRSLKLLAGGIQELSDQHPIHLPEKGMTELLAKQLNQTSDLLSRQKKKLEQRDNARTAWISGVSHDIRTPLSLVMGYASDLKSDGTLSDEQRRKARIIEHQSLQIKHLIEDLNLTSKLEYNMQPLRPAAFKPSGLLRTVVSNFYNQGLSENYRIDLYIDPDVEQITLEGDTALLSRAFTNLIQNSISHNKNGCTVTVTAYPQKDGICFQVSDDGCGIPDTVIRALTGELSGTEKAPHIMGLRIVQQIFQAHGWEMVFTDACTIHVLGRIQAKPQTTKAYPRKKRTNTAG